MNRIILSFTGLMVLAANVVKGQQYAGVNSSGVKEATTVSAERYSTSNNAEDDPSKAKSFTRTFPLGTADKVNLSNRYGSMVIRIWDRKEIKVDVDIRAYSNSEEDAQKLLDEVDIEAAKQGDQVVYKTNITSTNKNWGNGSRNGRRWRREVKVNYVVNMPAANALTLTQQYGNVDLQGLSGALSAKVQYGNFTAGNLSSNNNYITVQYGKTTIQQANKAVIKQQYGSGLKIETVGSLELNAQYSQVDVTTIKGNASIHQQYGSGLNIGSVDNLELDVQYASVDVNTIRGNANIKQQYNKLAIGTVGKLNLNSQYTGVTIGSLRGDGNFNMQYNTLSVANVGTGCKALNVDADYVNVNLAFANSFNASLDVETSYASFNYGDGISVNRQGTDEGHSSTKRYTGRIGNGSGATVKVDSDYGSVTFK